LAIVLLLKKGCDTDAQQPHVAQQSIGARVAFQSGIEQRLTKKPAGAGGCVINDWIIIRDSRIILMQTVIETPAFQKQAEKICS
jgi:hypothetical protein